MKNITFDIDPNKMREEFIPYCKRFSENLKRYCPKPSNFQDLKDEFWLTEQEIENFKAGTSLPNIFTLIDMCRMFNVSIDEMIGFKAK